MIARLRKPTELHRVNLDKAVGACLAPQETDLLADSKASWARVVRVTIPGGAIVSMSLTQRPDDIAHGVQSYQWPELEGPQTNLVFRIRADQELWAILSNSSNEGLAPRLTVMIEYPEVLPE